jgi:HK97 family phage major capsid protein
MDLNELIEARKQKLSELEGILTKGKDEKRELFTSENEQFNTIKNEIDGIDKQIDEKRKINLKNNNSTIKINKMENRFSLIKSIRDYVEGRGTSDATLAMNEQGKNEMINAGLATRGQIILPYETRAIVNATTAGEGEYAIADIKLDLIGALREELVAVKAGATLLNGLKGTVSIPVYAGTSSVWAATENATATDGAGAFTEIIMSAKRITTILDISKMFLNQDTTGAENLLMQDLTASILARLESSIFDATSAGSSRPAGIFNGVTYTSTGATSWAKIVALESAVNTANALTGKLAYITTPTLRGVGKTTAKDAGSGLFVIDANSSNGYPVYASSAVALGKMVFGNFADFLIGNWGAVDITVDPYTQAHLGVVRLVVNSYWDFAKRRTASFAYGNLT